MTRRRLILILCAAVAAMLGTPLAAAAAAAPSTPWAQGDSDAAHSRSNNAENTLSPSSVRGVALRGSISVPSSNSGPFCPTFGANHVTLSNGRVYGVFGGRVSSYDAGTRARIWHGAVNVSIDWTSVSVTNSLVVAGREGCSSAYNPAGAVTAFRVADGSTAWTRTARYGVFDTVVSDGVVVSSEFGKSNRTATEARSLSTGALLWSHETYCQDFYHAHVIGGRAVYVACNADQSNQRLVAVNLRSGATSWTRAAHLQVAAGDSDASSARHLYVQAANGAIQDLDPATGALQHTLSGATALLAVDGDRAYTMCGTSHVCAYATGSGNRRWSVFSDAYLAAVADGLVYLGDGRVLSAATGHLVRTLPYSSAGQLVVGDGRIGAVQSPQTFALYGLTGS